MGKRIYIADDEENIRSLMHTFLENEGYEVHSFEDGKSLWKAMEVKMPDLLILDIMMPGEDGLSICAAVRRTSNVPIIIVSAKDSPLDKISGITLGSDDYIVKPFLPLELVVRVKALFRRSEMSAAVNIEPPVLYTCGNMEVNEKERKVLFDGVPMAVTPTEFDFLLYLVKRKETAVSRKEVLEHVWHYQSAADDVRMADDLLKRLRKKMRQQNSEVMIETVWGYGYRMIAVDKGGES